VCAHAHERARMCRYLFTHTRREIQQLFVCVSACYEFCVFKLRLLLLTRGCTSDSFEHSTQEEGESKYHDLMCAGMHAQTQFYSSSRSHTRAHRDISRAWERRNYGSCVRTGQFAEGTIANAQ